MTRFSQKFRRLVRRISIACVLASMVGLGLEHALDRRFKKRTLSTDWSHTMLAKGAGVWDLVINEAYL